MKIEIKSEGKVLWCGEAENYQDASDKFTEGLTIKEIR